MTVYQIFEVGKAGQSERMPIILKLEMIDSCDSLERSRYRRMAGGQPTCS